MKKLIIGYEVRTNDFKEACEEMNLETYELEQILHDEFNSLNFDYTVNFAEGDTKCFGSVYWQRYYIETESDIEDIDIFLDEIRDKYVGYVEVV